MSEKKPDIRYWKGEWRDPDDGPELTGEELERPDTLFYVGGELMPREEGKAAFKAMLKEMFAKRAKRRVTLMLDGDLIDYFKEQAEGRGYQTLINHALREWMESEQGEERLRRVVREELAPYFTSQEPER